MTQSASFQEAHRDVNRHAQQGIAAIEFAFVFIGLFLCLHIVGTFGAAFYTQQVVIRAAEDGARAISLLPTALAANDPRIQMVVHESLARSLIAPAGGSNQPPASPEHSGMGGYESRKAWITAQVAVSVPPPLNTPNGREVHVTVTYPYNQNPLLPSLPGLGVLIPAQLVGRAAVALHS